MNLAQMAGQAPAPDENDPGHESMESPQVEAGENDEGAEGETSGVTNASPDAKSASPQQQQQFDLLLGRARQLMAKSGEEWVAALKKAPVDAAVHLGVETLRTMVQSSEQAGQKVDPIVLVHVGVQLTKDIAALANACGAVPDEQLEPYLKDVMSQSVAQWLDMDDQDGLLNPEDKQRAQQALGGAPAGPPQGSLEQMQGGA